MAVKTFGSGSVLTGPVGNAGPSGLPYLNYPYGQVPAFGQLCSINAVNISTNIYVMDVGGTQNLLALIKPLQNTALFQVIFTNAAASPNSATLSLRNYANDALIYSTGAQVKGSTYASGAFNSTSYVLQAGQTYYWGIQGAANGTYTCWAVPSFYTPSASPASTSAHPSFVLNPSTALFGTTTLSNTATYMGPVGFRTGNQLTFQIPFGGYVSNVQFANPGGATSGTANFFLQNVTAGTLAWTGPSVATGATATTGFLPPSTIPLTGNTKYAWYVTGSGTMGQHVSMQICQ